MTIMKLNGKIVVAFVEKSWDTEDCSKLHYQEDNSCNMFHVSSTGKIVKIRKIRAKKRRELPAKEKKAVSSLRRSSRWIQDGDVRLHKEAICAEEAGKFALYLTFDD